MTEIKHSGSENTPARHLTDDELGEWIVDRMNQVADLPDDAPVSKNLLALIAGHSESDRVSRVPQNDMELEFLRSFVKLEARIRRLEHAVRAAGINVPETTE